MVVNGQNAGNGSCTRSNVFAAIGSCTIYHRLSQYGCVVTEREFGGSWRDEYNYLSGIFLQNCASQSPYTSDTCGSQMDIIGTTIRGRIPT